MSSKVRSPRYYVVSVLARTETGNIVHHLSTVMVESKELQRFQTYESAARRKAVLSMEKTSELIEGLTRVDSIFSQEVMGFVD